MSFAEKLRAARIAAGFTQKDFAAKIGVNQSSYRNWENAVTLPTFPNFQKIVRGLQSVTRSGRELVYLSSRELKEEFVNAKKEAGKRGKN